MVGCLLNFRVSKSNLWLSNVFLTLLNGCRTSFSFSMATVSPLFLWYLWRYRQGICRQSHTMGVRGQKRPHSLSSWSPLLTESDFLGIHWGCRNRRGPLKADLKEQRAQPLRCFLGKAILLYSYSLCSTRLCLTDNIITHLVFSSITPTSIILSSSDAESGERIRSCQEELYMRLWFVRAAGALPLSGAGPERTV